MNFMDIKHHASRNGVVHTSFLVCKYIGIEETLKALKEGYSCDQIRIKNEVATGVKSDPTHKYCVGIRVGLKDAQNHLLDGWKLALGVDCWDEEELDFQTAMQHAVKGYRVQRVDWNGAFVDYDGFRLRLNGLVPMYVTSFDIDKKWRLV